MDNTNVRRKLKSTKNNYSAQTNTKLHTGSTKFNKNQNKILILAKQGQEI